MNVNFFRIRVLKQKRKSIRIEFKQHRTTNAKEHETNENTVIIHRICYCHCVADNTSPTGLGVQVFSNAGRGKPYLQFLRAEGIP